VVRAEVGQPALAIESKGEVSVEHNRVDSIFVHWQLSEGHCVGDHVLKIHIGEFHVGGRGGEVEAALWNGLVAGIGGRIANYLIV